MTKSRIKAVIAAFALSIAVAVGFMLPSGAQASQPGGGPSWCSSGGWLCVWAQDTYGGKGDYWSASDPSWHAGTGTNVADDDDSLANYTGYWVKTYNDVDYGGGCEWKASSPSAFPGISNNDDGSSHKRFSSNPSC